jgi:hypothetical protein
MKCFMLKTNILLSSYFSILTLCTAISQLPYINSYYSEKQFGEIGLVIAYADSSYYLSGMLGENQ